MGTTRTNREYALAEFTSASPLNVAIFAQEIEADSGVTEKPDRVYQSASVVIVEWTSLDPSSGSIAAVDALVPAHVGGAFPEDRRFGAAANAQTTESAGTWETKLTLNTGVLPAGTYALDVACEIDVASVVADTGVEARLLYGGAEAILDSWDRDRPHIVSAGLSVSIVDGKEIDIELQFRKYGVAANTARCRRARASVAPAPANG